MLWSPLIPLFQQSEYPQPTSLTFDNILGAAQQSPAFFATHSPYVCLATNLLWSSTVCVCLLIYRYWCRLLLCLQLPMYRYVLPSSKKDRHWTTDDYRVADGYLSKAKIAPIYSLTSSSVWVLLRRRGTITKYFFALTVTVPVMNRSFLL